jgi:hypothetical protein
MPDKTIEQIDAELEKEDNVHTKPGHTLTHSGESHHARKMKVRYATEEVEIEENLDKACWKGYEAIGTKRKYGKTVPNCVPVNEEDAIDEKEFDEIESKMRELTTVVTGKQD